MNKFALMFLIGLLIVPFVFAQDCTDSDGGKNYYEKGIVEVFVNGSKISNWYDVCIQDFETKEIFGLREYWCEDSKARSADITCPNGCENGACNPLPEEEVPEEEECYDSDGGKDYYVAGYTTIDNGYHKHWDACGENIDTGIETLSETYCEDNTPKEESYNCPHGCKDGVCLKEPEQKCTDSDGGKNIYVKGKTCVGDDCKPDVCTDDIHLSEYYCQSENDRGDNWITCPYGCKDGVCLKKCAEEGENVYDMASKGPISCCSGLVLEKCEGLCTPSIPGTCVKETSKCTDSDGGVDYYVKGTATDKNGKSYTDLCGQGGVYEYHCDPSNLGYVTTKWLKCSQGCEDGACIKEVKCPIEEIICEKGSEPQSYIGDDGCTHWKCVPVGKYVKLGEKFSLREGGEAKVVDYSYMKIRLNELDAIACTALEGCDTPDWYAHLTVEMPPTETADITSTGTGTKFEIRVGDSKEVFGAKITFLGTGSSTDVNLRSGMFIVEKSITQDLVDIEIYPKEQTIGYSDKAVYKVKVTDKHPMLRCEPGTRCLVPPLTYNIKIRNLPFLKEYPHKIEVPYSGIKEFELVVTPYQKVVLESEAEEVKASTAITGQVVAKAVKKQDLITKSTESVVEAKAIPEKAVIATTQKMVVRHIRHYKFSVTAVQQDKPSVQDTAVAVLIIKPEVPPPLPPTPPPFPGDKISIKLHRGWNLISLPGKLVRFDKESLIGKQKLIGFIYIKEKQKYFTLKEAEELLGDKLREYLAKNAFWIYSKNPMSLNIWINREISLEGIDIVKGWNLVPVTEDMVGGYLTDVIGDCDTEKIYIWDALNQKWRKIEIQYSFDTSQVGYGFLLKSKNNCRLSGPTILPPSMPE